jgi:hypothetical protein
MDKDDLIALLTTELQELRIRVTQLEQVVGPTREETESRARRATEEYEHSARRAAASTFQPGDRIRINKTLKKPADWDNVVEWDQKLAQTATVTQFKNKQVWFVTDNGVRTWRAINNVTKIER